VSTEKSSIVPVLPQTLSKTWLGGMKFFRSGVESAPVTALCVIFRQTPCRSVGEVRIPKPSFTFCIEKKTTRLLFSWKRKAMLIFTGREKSLFNILGKEL